MKDDDDRYELDDDENEESRSIFSATWFRVVLATVAVGVIGAVALPYMLGSGTSAPEKTASAPPPLLDTKPAASLATPPPEGSGPRVSVTPPTPGGSAVTAPGSESGRPEPAPAAAPPPAPAKASAPLKSPSPQSEVAQAPPRPKADADRPVPRAQAKRPVPPKPAAQVRTASAKPPSAKSASATATRKAYWVQVGTFKDPAAAQRLAAKLRDQKHVVASRPVTIADSNDQLSRVRVGPFADRATAASTVRTLQAHGFKPFVVNVGA